MRAYNIAITCILSFVILIGVSLPSSAQNFEGIIHYEVSEMGQQGMNNMPYMIKGNKARIEMGSGQKQAAMLLFPEKSKTVLLMDSMSGYMEMDNKGAKSNADNLSDAKATLTGETKTIVGRECEVLRTETADNVIEACMARGLGSFMMPQDPMGKKQAPAWAKELFSKGAMPLEVVQINNNKRTIQMKAIKIEEKPLSDDLFTIPEGYRDMSGMMRQMRNRRQN